MQHKLLGLMTALQAADAGVSAKLYMKHANCNIPTYLLPSITIETGNMRQNKTADPYSYLRGWHPERKKLTCILFKKH